MCATTRAPRGRGKAVLKRAHGPIRIWVQRFLVLMILLVIVIPAAITAPPASLSVDHEHE
jgi:hypothetical protein